MYKAILFDLDGTLLNTLGDLCESVNYALEACGYPKRSIEEVRRFIGNGVIKLMERSTPDGISKDSQKKCFNLFRLHYLEHMRDSTRPFENIPELLEEIKKRGVLTAVVSNKLHSAVVGLCDEFFGDNITCAFGVKNESERKPSPANVFKAIERLGVTAEQTVYVGDSEVDVQTANNAGLDCIGVTWGYRDREELTEAGARFVVDSPDEILDVIRNA